MIVRTFVTFYQLHQVLVEKQALGSMRGICGVQVLERFVSDERNPGWLGYIGDENPPSYIGIIIYQCKDPY